LKKIIRGIVSGMLHLHCERIVHRDLAPRNILLTNERVPKISDFGLSRVTDSDQSQTKSDTGPLKHMAPECLLKMKYGFKSDVWAFGVTLWEIYERNDPYPNLSMIEVATQVAQTTDPLRLTAPKNMSSSMKKLFLSCIETLPENRPTFEQILLDIDTMENFFAKEKN